MRKERRKTDFTLNILNTSFMELKKISQRLKLTPFKLKRKTFLSTLYNLFLDR